jgi:hypothetical protein
MSTYSLYEFVMNAPADAAPKDPNVFSFMIQLVQERYGPTATPEFLEKEADRIYELFGDKLVEYFEPMLSDQQKEQFNQMVSQGQDQESLLNFLVSSIENLETQIMSVLMQFKDDYIGGKF